MKTFAKILVLIVLIAGIVSIIHFFTNNDSAKIEKLKLQIKQRNAILQNQKNTIYTQIIDIGQLTSERNKAVRSFKKLKVESESIKTPAIIRTLTKEKIIIEYEKVYYYLGRSLNEFSILVNNGIDIDKKLKELFPVVVDYIETSEENTEDREKIIDILSDNKFKVYSLFQYQNLAIEDHLSLEVFVIKKIHKNLSLRISYKLFYYLEVEHGFSVGLQFQIL